MTDFNPAGSNLIENLRESRAHRSQMLPRYTIVPEGPMLCGKCAQFGVTREADDETATYTCSACGITKTIKRKWEADNARTEAGLIGRPTNRSGM